MIFTAIHELGERNSDPRAKKYFLMSSIWQPLGIVFVYLLFFRIIGPWMMKNRKPFNFRKSIMTYNVIQVVLNFYLVVKVFHGFSQRDNSFSGRCLDIDYTNSERGLRELNCAYLYFLIKILDLSDTLFILLRKSFRQMSFLHVYHHAVMVFSTWMGVKFFGGGHGGWIGLLNSIIHIFMYAYYFASAYNPNFKQFPFRKVLTQLQLTQFVLLLYFYGISLFASSCHYSKGLSLFIVCQALVFIYLFGDFYYKTYVKQRTDPKSKIQ